MRLYFIRHGQTVLNSQGIIAGQSETPLTENGIMQAKQAAKKLEGVHFDAVFSSDLSRAVQTQETMLPGITAVTSPLLREYDMGCLVGKSVAELREKYGKRLEDSFCSHTYRQFGGEDLEDVKARVEKFLENVIDKDYENVAVFCHSGVCKTMLSITFDRNELLANCDNCAVNIFEYEDGMYRLIKWNY